MHFVAKFSGIKIDKPKLTKDFDTRATSLMKQAAREWLRAVVVSVPVWTGFALGSVKFATGPKGNLGQFLHLSIPIKQTHPLPRWYYHPGRGRVEKIPGNASKFSYYTFSTARHIFQFSFRSDVVHFILNDFYATRVSPTSPWASLEAGKKAFMDYFYANLHKKLPDIRKYTYVIPLVEITESQVKILESSGAVVG